MNKAFTYGSLAIAVIKTLRKSADHFFLPSAIFLHLRLFYQSIDAKRRKTKFGNDEG